MIEKINQTFEGDLNDKTPSHKNSLCRIVYTVYLANQGLKTGEIAKKMNCCRSFVSFVTCGKSEQVKLKISITSS